VERSDVAIVGGGIAGLAAALALARGGLRPLLLEREPILASHSSGRNAAIWLGVHAEASTPLLAPRSAEVLDGLLGPDAWIRRSGALLVGEDARLVAEARRHAERCGAGAKELDARDAVRLCPALAGGTTRAALWLPDAGVLDIHAMTQALARAARAAGARIRTGCGAARVAARAGRVEGVDLDDGSRVGADAVLVAAGAWAGALGAACGAPLPLTPLRRHLAHLEAPAAELAAGPVLWSLDGEVYWRPESGGLLASPCDEEPWEPGLPASDEAALEDLARKLRRLAPPLAACRVRRSWACLRTFAPDRELVAGADPRLEGLFWLAGLGGRGMTVGVAAGELAAASLLGRAHPLAETTAPARLLP